MRSCFATVLARVIDGSPPGARGWHPFGLADASGFAAMARDEFAERRSDRRRIHLTFQLPQALRMRVGHTRPAFWVHSDDIARGLQVPFDPPESLVRATLERLFPWAPAGVNPWPALLWANGRIDLPGQERQVDWRWQCAPLEEWDGLNPADRH